MNSRAKGARGEREFAKFLRDEGFDARRGQQFSGSADSPDVVWGLGDKWHIEVKRVQRLCLDDAIAQAEGDAGGRKWVIAHRKNDTPWKVTLLATEYLQLIRESESI